MTKKTVQALCLILLLVPVGAQEDAITSHSGMNWNTRLIKSVISLDVKKKGIQLPTGRNAALQMLEMETPALLKDTFFSIIVNSSEKLGNSVEQNRISLSDLNMIIDTGKKTPPYFSTNLEQISMSHTISLIDIGSLFIKHSVANIPRTPLASVPSREYSGILIDARGTFGIHGEYTSAALVPCLFPKIWSKDMDLLYEKNMVEPNAAKKQGIVHYSSSLDESSYRDRIGPDPLRIIAREIFGENRTDPVISTSDYLKILSIPANKKLLLEGRIVIICNQDQLESEGLGPVKDGNYYFIAQEIGDNLQAQGVTRIDFSNAWEGLKLTIYDIRFVADTAEILPSEKNRLDLIAEALKLAGPTAGFLVEGHTASVGKAEGELKLSIERAAKIADELSLRGIDSSRIVSAGYGGTRSVASNDTEEGRSQNRRVEITIKLD